MKKQFLLSTIFLVITSFAIAQQRDLLWLFGNAATSAQWTRGITSAQANGYDFNAINIYPYDNNTNANTIPDWASFFNDKLTTNNDTDVLGIGHDAGGLILRYMGMTQQNGQNGRLSAMILDGVPNHGGRIFTKLLPISPSVPSEVQSVVEKLLDIRTGAQGCAEGSCNMIDATKDWVDLFATSDTKTYFEQLKPTNPVITNLQTPSIPFAVIWGNADKDALTLTRMISSWYDRADTGDDDDYLDCYRSRARQRLIAAQQQHSLSLLSSIAGLAGFFGKISATNPLTVGNAIEAGINALVTRLRADQALKTEIRELLECELIHQALNAKWNLILSPYQVITQTVQVPCISCDPCYTEPDPQVQGWCWQNCTEGCDPFTSTVTVTNTYIQYEPHDGLLTKTEQLLAGALKTYEAKGCNHLQEQFWEYPIIDVTFKDLFDGGAGDAFRVPK